MKTKQLKPYLLLWGTQSLSTLGSGMTSYALVLWLYLQTGSALQTALLSVASYAPYVGEWVEYTKQKQPHKEDKHYDNNNNLPEQKKRTQIHRDSQ